MVLNFCSCDDVMVPLDEIIKELEMEDVKGEEKTEEQELTKSQDDEKENKEEPKKSLKSKIISGLCELLLYAVIALVCIFIIPKYVVQKTEVSGPSMESTLHDEDNILVEKLSYRFTDPDRFDIIVFYHFDDMDNQDKSDEDAYDLYVKRIIGLPGETVQIIGETIYINGEPLEEHYGKDPITDPGVAQEMIVLGEDEYFVLGDNREVSKDSRSDEVRNIKRDLIVGRAWVRLYPFDKIGFLTE